MKLLGYIVEGNARSRQPWSHFKIHNHCETKHLVWGKISIHFGHVQYCEECGVENGLEALCQTCYEHHYCECGQRLEDYYGSPGDGFCVRCR